MGRIVVEGARARLVLCAVVLVLAMLGLSPALAWVPEGPLLGAAILLPVVTYAVTGYRTARRTSSMSAGVIAASVAGVVSGCFAGLMYVNFGKSALNILVDSVLGAVGGAVVGALAAWWSRRTTRP